MLHIVPLCGYSDAVDGLMVNLKAYRCPTTITQTLNHSRLYEEKMSLKYIILVNIHWQSWLYTTPTCLRISSSTSASRRESAWDITELSLSPIWNKHSVLSWLLAWTVNTCSHQGFLSLMPPGVESVYKTSQNTCTWRNPFKSASFWYWANALIYFYMSS